MGSLLLLSVAIYSLELSGRWDRTFQDANDEAAVVVMVLCVGVAFGVATALARLVRIPARARSFVMRLFIPRWTAAVPVLIAASSPPLPLRV